MFRTCAGALLISIFAIANPAVAGNFGKPDDHFLAKQPPTYHPTLCGLALIRDCFDNKRDFPVDRWRRISCAEARDILADRGFSRIKTVSCNGINYKFTGRWKGKSYRLLVSRTSGDFVSMKRIK